MQGTILIYNQGGMSIAVIIFNGAAGSFFDKISQNAPFFVLGVIDTVFLLYTIFCLLRGQMFSNIKDKEDIDNRDEVSLEDQKPAIEDPEWANTLDQDANR